MFRPKFAQNSFSSPASSTKIYHQLKATAPKIEGLLLSSDEFSFDATFLCASANREREMLRWWRMFVVRGRATLCLLAITTRRSP